MQESSLSWNPVSTGHLLAATCGLSAFLCLLAFDEDGFIFLDYVNLAFHEAGHPFFGLLGNTAGLYGGTIGQLLFPIIAAVAFRRQHEPVGYMVACVWFFENFLNIARYVADARVQVLPLVGGGEHDWAIILTRWGALSSDIRIARIVATAGWVGMSAAWIWLFLLWRHQRGRAVS